MSLRTRSAARIGTTLGIATAICFLAGLLAAPNAAAHAELVRSNPADGARLTAVPSLVTLEFSEEIAVGQCAVDVDGTAMPVRASTGRPDVLIADLSGVKAHEGALTLEWRSVSSDDGHVATGTLHYQLALAGSSAPTASAALPAPTAPATVDGSAAQVSLPPIPTPDPAVKQALTTAQFLGFTATTLFVGGLAFVGLIWPPGGGEKRTRRLLGTAWTVGLLSTVAMIPLNAGNAALLPLSGVLNGTAVQNLLGTRLGAVLVARALIWIAAGVVLAAVLQRGDRAARSPSWRIGLFAVGFGLLRTASMPGHDDDAHPLAGAIADTVHLAGAALWIGGLVVLLIGVLPRRRPEELAAVVARYSRLALVSVTAIIAAGAVLAWHLLGSTQALLHTSYGHLLLVKLCIVATVLLLAQHSKAWVRHRLDIAVLLDGDQAIVRTFLFSVAAETGLALAILAAASVLVSSSPGR